MNAPLFLLIHSPLVGPYSWSLVAEQLRRRGLGAAMAALHDQGEAGGPFWRQHALAAATMLAAMPRGRPVLLVGHSGAGPLLPAIRALADRTVDGYLFVDAGIPADGLSRLELLRAELPEVAGSLSTHLEAGGRFPEWDGATLAEAVPDAERRVRLLAEMQPRGLLFWTEPIAVFAGWPDAPCAYLQLSDGYDHPAALARRDGWAASRLGGGHFQTLNDPATVVDAMIALTRALGIPVATEGARA